VIVDGLVLTALLRVVRWCPTVQDMVTALRDSASVKMVGRVIFAMLRLIVLMIVTTEVFVLRASATAGVVMVVCHARTRSAPTHVLATELASRPRRRHQEHLCNVLVRMDGLALTALCRIVLVIAPTMESATMVLVIVIACTRVRIVQSMLNLVPTTALDMVFAPKSWASVFAVVSGTGLHVPSGSTLLMVLLLILAATTALVMVSVYTWIMGPHHTTVPVHPILLDHLVRQLVRQGAADTDVASVECVGVMMDGRVIVVSGACVQATVTTTVTVVMGCACVRMVMLVRTAVCSQKRPCRISVSSTVRPSASRRAHWCTRCHPLMGLPRRMTVTTSARSLVCLSVSRVG